MPDPDIVQEGAVHLDLPARAAGAKGPGTIGAGPFYNPAMRFNRDLSVLVLSARMATTPHERPFRVYDGLAASGARGLRLAKETTTRTAQTIEVVCNDRDADAAERIRRHAEANGVADRVEARHADFAYGFHGERFDHVDIDPFGSPMPFVDPALRHVRRGGTIAATATDVAALCGVHPNACLRRYDAVPWHGPAMHEVALRILAGAIVRHAAQSDQAARPILMHATDHYMRVYLEVEKGAQRADAALRQIGWAVEGVDGTRSLVARDSAPPTDARRVAGPLWTGPLHDAALVADLRERHLGHETLDAAPLDRFLDVAAEEAVGPGLFYEVGELSRTTKRNAPTREVLIDRLRAGGHHACRTHVDPAAIKTDAPMPTILAAFS